MRILAAALRFVAVPGVAAAMPEILGKPVFGRTFVSGPGPGPGPTAAGFPRRRDGARDLPRVGK